MDKKAQGLSVNVIILAAIALLVLIILAVLVLRAGTGVTKGTSCTALGGTCAADCQTLEGNYYADSANGGKAGGCAENEVCCRTLTPTNP